MRGKPGRVPKIICHLRNIPAYAGKTSASAGNKNCATEHPRVCGENLKHIRDSLTRVGTSPRMRGKPILVGHKPGAGRNIPAYAGKTVIFPACCVRSAEHPRVCGENRCAHPYSSSAHGTSPRMRGKPRAGRKSQPVLRNIPAYAGKTTWTSTQTKNWSEHPRVCGENNNISILLNRTRGTSPRMRGKL